jgi:thiol:disulfide interchange protein DsbD
MKQRLFCLLLLTLAAPAYAGGERELLSPQEAFPATARARGLQVIEVHFRIAKGYYLYRDKLRFTPASDSLRLGEPQLPKGRVKQDEFFGKVEIYHGDLIVKLPLREAKSGRVEVRVEAQGCAEIIGVCYPPFEQVVGATFPGRPVSLP